MDDEQLRGRIYRYPQQKQVHIYRLIAQGTPDVFLNTLAFTKGHMQQAFVEPRLDKEFSKPPYSFNPYRRLLIEHVSGNMFSAPDDDLEIIDIESVASGVDGHDTDSTDPPPQPAPSRKHRPLKRKAAESPPPSPPPNQKRRGKDGGKKRGKGEGEEVVVVVENGKGKGKKMGQLNDNPSEESEGDKSREKKMAPKPRLRKANPNVTSEEDVEVQMISIQPHHFIPPCSPSASNTRSAMASPVPTISDVPGLPGCHLPPVPPFASPKACSITDPSSKSPRTPISVDSLFGDPISQAVVDDPMDTEEVRQMARLTVSPTRDTSHTNQSSSRSVSISRSSLIFNPPKTREVQRAIAHQGSAMMADDDDDDLSLGPGHSGNFAAGSHNGDNRGRSNGRGRGRGRSRCTNPAARHRT
jgi:hypothetical protein